MKQLYFLFLLLFFKYLKINCQLTNDSSTIAVFPELTTTTTILSTKLITNVILTDSTNLITTSYLNTNNNNNTTITTTTPIITKSTTFSIETTTKNSNELNLQLNVGLLFGNGSKDLRSQFGFGQSAPAISLAIQRANNEQLINNINFNFTWFMCDCDETLAAGYTNQLFLNLSVDVILASLMTAYLSKFYNLPVFLWGATVSSVFNVIPTVTNINTNTVMLSMGVQSVLSLFQWQEISLVYVPDTIGRVCTYFKQDFESILNNNPNITIVYTKLMDTTLSTMKNTLRKIQTCSRIIVSCFDSNIDRRNFLLAMSDLGIVENTEYVLIIAQLKNQGMLQEINSSGINGVQYDNGGNDGRDADALKAARRAIIIDLENQSIDQINTFNKQMYSQFGQPPFNCNGSCMGGPNEQNPSPYSRSLFDTTYAYLRALNLTMQKYGYLSSDLARNGTLINNMSRGEFDGETGIVNLDSIGNRVPTFYVTILDISDKPQDVVQISIVNNIVSLTKKYNDEATIWANRGGKRPLYKPLCGYAGTECPQNMTTYILIGSGLILLLFLATISGIGYAVREKLKEKERLTKECLIPYGELKNIKELKSNEDLKNMDGNKSLKSLQSSQSGSTKLTSMDNKKLETDNYAHFLYNREIVFAIKYQVRVRIFNEDYIQLRKIRQLDHDNLNKFCGLCIDAPILYSIWKHCQRGSLKDLIAKERYVGDSFVMFTLMRDITNGLIALHQSFICAHGMLSSENCLINDRWQVKISDFGLNMIRESQPITKKKLLWTAPELLRENNRKGTKEGDIYSFAIICCELINRETVWNGVEREDDVDEIIYRLRRSNVAIPHRPQLHPREEINQNLVRKLFNKQN
ncbi:Guanylate cyclase [Meloidogyne graminicola]|uniref:guanylate cyclase n=1 Tax=Meloidogyne graminicola TaxID=189291 RepID=A0A8S9ZL93_9BILA|nr:Guanylate cyclase [Meloidogyne graminicola]